MENIDKIIYINLDHRTDRRKEIEEEFEKYNFPLDKIIRFSAYRDQNGALGCTRSHYNVIKFAREQNYKNVLILEDDFQMVVSKEELDKSLNYFFNLQFEKPWDVLMLAYNIGEPHSVVENYKDDKVIGRVRFAQSASAYLVNGSYLETLEKHMGEGLHLFEQTGAFYIFMNDVYWQHLQRRDEWFYFLNRISIQRESFSDLNNQKVNYNY